MKYLKYVVMIGLFVLVAGSAAHAQVAVQFGGPGYIGPPPFCAYGYYGYAPYACAPYGYYGPDYFAGGVFIGAGPWFHGFYGGRGFYGRGPAFYSRGWYGHEDGFRGRGEFHGEGGWHGNGFRGEAPVRGGG